LDGCGNSTEPFEYLISILGTIPLKLMFGYCIPYWWIFSCSRV